MLQHLTSRPDAKPCSLGEIFMHPEFLTKADIENYLLQLDNIDLTVITIEEIKERLKILFTGYTLDSPIIPAGLNLFRGIIYDNKPTNISLLSYPPIKYAKMNRASRQNQQFFYAAISRNVPLFELGLEEGNKFVLARWQTQKELLINNIGYTENNFKSLNSKRASPKWDNNEHSLISKDELNDFIHIYLAETFCQKVPKDNPDLYKLTIAIAEKLHSENEISNVKFDGILYPSIAMNANSDNIVVRKSFIDEGNLIFMEAEWIVVKKVHDFKYDVDVLDWANSISDTGEIEWKGRLQLWDIFPDEGFYFADENGRRIGKNMYGETIEPY